MSDRGRVPARAWAISARTGSRLWWYPARRRRRGYAPHGGRATCVARKGKVRTIGGALADRVESTARGAGAPMCASADLAGSRVRRPSARHRRGHVRGGRRACCGSPRARIGRARCPRTPVSSASPVPRLAGCRAGRLLSELDGQRAAPPSRGRVSHGAMRCGAACTGRQTPQYHPPPRARGGPR